MPIEKVPGDRRSPGRNARVPPSHPMSPPQNCLGISKSRRRHLNRAGSRVYGFCAVRSYHRSRRSAPNTRLSAARTTTEIGLFSTNLSHTAPSIGGLLEDKIAEGLSYTISSHLYTTVSWP